MSQAIRLLYTATSSGLGTCAVISHLNRGPAHALYTAACALAAVLLIVAVHRETSCADDHQPTGAPEPTDEHDEPAGDPAATQVQAWLHALNDLDAACCERWWTSLATDHDPTCPHQQPWSTR
ncbi:hypothetical protein ACWD11_22680 [Streptomyces sp. NPDC002776]